MAFGLDLAVGLAIALTRDAIVHRFAHSSFHGLNIEPADNAQSTVAGGFSGSSHSQSIGESMSYDLVGDDDDYGSIGMEPEYVGEDNFLDALVSGELDALISGDGTSEIIGAVRSKNPKKNAALRQLAMKQAGAVIKRGLDRKRRYPLGVVPTTVTSGSTATIPTTPQNLFRAERLVIPSDISFDIGVSDVKVGNQSQFVETSEVPGALFSEVAINTGVTFDTAEIGNQISLAIRNKSLADVEFVAGFIGTIAK